tara:strand:- start:126 stop:1973 length:1848 start_codon:yes stop_codon:yes gene_type:complete
MNTVTEAEALSDRQRLWEDRAITGELCGIVTSDWADGELYVLSRYEEDVWTLPASSAPRNMQASGRILDFGTIGSSQLRAEVKHVMMRLLFGPDNLATSTLVSYFKNVRQWANWLHSIGVSNFSRVTPLVSARYVEYVAGLRTNQGKPFSPTHKSKLFYAVELCWMHLRDTSSSFNHPWPESTGIALAKVERHTRPKTPIIPVEVLAPLFEYAESFLSKSDELIGHRNAIAGLESLSKYKANRQIQINRFLKSRGWPDGGGALSETLLTLRDCCFLIILVTTGIRAHELGNLRRNEWFSEIKEGERFYYLVSRSDKTYENETVWLCPEIAIGAIKALEKLSEPLQLDLEAALEAARKTNHYHEISRLTNIFGCVGLTKDPGRFNKISVLSRLSLSTRLRSLVKELSLNWNLGIHQFRRTFANHVVHHKLGDLRYLRDHFKHWSLDMTALYGMNEKQELELYDEIYAAFAEKRQAIIGHWLEPDTRLSGGLAPHVRQMRSRNENLRTYKDRREMVRSISDLVFLRSTGIAWCTNDTGVDCAGGQCEACEHGCVDDSHKPFWEGLYVQQIELRQIEGLGEAGSKTVERTIDRCEQVLADLGVDLNSPKEQMANVSST